MPRTVRSLLRVMGARDEEGSDLVSYLLFEADYTRELIALGRADVMARRDDVLAFLEPPRPADNWDESAVEPARA